MRGASRGFHSSAAARADYYETLGVSKKASAGEIKKAYHQLAKKHHPDANKDDPEGASKRFQEVQKAYEVLKDPEKRGMYDQVGHGNFENMENNGGGGGGFAGGFPGGGMGGQGFEGFPGGFRMHFHQSGGGGGMDPFEEIFSDFFGGGRGPSRDIQASVVVTLAEVASGTAKTITIPETTTVDPRTGKRETHKAREVSVDLPAGVEDGQRLRVPGEGLRVSTPNGVRVGSLYINVEVAPDARFKRVGRDLVTVVELNVAEAALGGTAHAPTLDGSVEVKVRQPTQPGDQLRLRGRGLPELQTPFKGDLFVQFRVKVPKTMTPRQKELLEEFAEIERERNSKPVATEDPIKEEKKVQETEEKKAEEAA